MTCRIFACRCALFILLQPLIFVPSLTGRCTSNLAQRTHSKRERGVAVAIPKPGLLQQSSLRTWRSELSAYLFPMLQMNLCQPRQGYRLGESVKGYPPRVPPRVRDAGCGMRCKPTVLSPDHFRQRTSGFVTRPTRAVNSRAPKLQPGCRGGRKVCFLHPSSSPFCRHLLGLLK